MHYSLSSIEVEHKVTIKGACEAVWLSKILADLMIEQIGPTTNIL
jgi:hypothetical protein